MESGKVILRERKNMGQYIIYKLSTLNDGQQPIFNPLIMDTYFQLHKNISNEVKRNILETAWV